MPVKMDILTKNDEQIMETATRTRKAQAVDIPAKVLNAFRKYCDRYRFNYERAQASGLHENTIKNIFLKKSCSPDTLEILYKLTGIEKPEP